MKILFKPLIYFSTKLNRNQFLAVLAIIVGLAAGIAAVMLKTVVHYLQSFIFEYHTNWYFYILFPGLGILISVWIIQRYFNGKIEKGVESVIDDIDNKSSIVPSSKIFSNFITSAITIGLGGSSGLEGPIVATGSAIGANLSMPYQLDYRERTLMLAAGAAAGIAAIFNAPVTGMIFAMEVLLADALVTNFIPLMLASVSGILCSKVFLKGSILLSFPYQQDFDHRNILLYTIFGFFCGLITLAYLNISATVKSYIGAVFQQPYKRALFGGFVLMILCFVFPPLFGEGYNFISAIANIKYAYLSQNTFINLVVGSPWWYLFLIVTMFAKAIATSVTINSGGNGGNFAPSLFVGGLSGFIFSSGLNSTGWFNLPVSNFTLVGMAGALSGIFYAPLTAIFLIAEVAKGYELFVPLMTVSSISFFIVRHYHKHGILRSSVFARGPKAKTSISKSNVTSFLETDVEVLSDKDKLQDLIEVVKKSKKYIYVVTGRGGVLAGLIKFEDIAEVIFENQHYEYSVLRFSKMPEELIYLEDSQADMMHKFERTNTWLLPVVDHKNKFLGFVSKTSLLDEYRKEIISEVCLT